MNGELQSLLFVSFHLFFVWLLLYYYDHQHCKMLVRYSGFACYWKARKITIHGCLADNISIGKTEFLTLYPNKILWNLSLQHLHLQWTNIAIILLKLWNFDINKLLLLLARLVRLGLVRTLLQILVSKGQWKVKLESVTKLNRGCVMSKPNK